MTRTIIFVLITLATAAQAGRSPDSLYIKVFQSPYLWRTDKEGRGLVADQSFAWLDAQTGPCMDPVGNYIYEVYETTLRRHDARTGSHVDYPVANSARSVGCGTDGRHFYYGWTARRIAKTALDGTLVSVTEMPRYYECYHGMGVARDTFWIVSNDFAPLDYQGYPCSEFTGDTAHYYSTIHNPLASVGIGMPICWDGSRFYAACGGYSTSPIIWWDSQHNMVDSVMIDKDIRSVMCVDTTWTGIAEPGRRSDNTRTVRASVSRGVLFLAGTTGPAELLDLSGRSVMALASGANDVRRLPPGVYTVIAANRVLARVVLLR